VIEEAIDPAFLHQSPIRSIPSYEPLGAGHSLDRRMEKDSLAAEVDSAVVNIWKSIGYLDQN
jgi:hypothetical protein